MQRDGNEFWSVLNLLPGVYHYKFGAFNPPPLPPFSFYPLRPAAASRFLGPLLLLLLTGWAGGAVVDGEWMYAPDHATTRDARGNMSNNIRVEPWEVIFWFCSCWRWRRWRCMCGPVRCEEACTETPACVVAPWARLNQRTLQSDIEDDIITPPSPRSSYARLTPTDQDFYAKVIAQ